MCFKTFIQGVTLFVLAISLIYSLSSCSVKEERLSCPLLYELHYEEHISIKSVKLILQNENYWNKADSLLLNKDSVYTTLVPKHDFRLLAVSPANIILSKDFSYQCEDNTDYPDLYVCKSLYKRYEEKVLDTLHLHKNFSRLKINFKDFDSKSNLIRAIAVYSKTSGFDAKYNVLRKSWHRYLDHISERMSVNIPRQVDNSLILKIFFDNEKSKTFYLGNFLQEINFDWAKEDLDDSNINIDIDLLTFNISINIWKEETKFNIII